MGYRVVSTVQRLLPPATGPFSTAFTVAQLTNGLNPTGTEQPRVVQPKEFMVQVMLDHGAAFNTCSVQLGIFNNFGTFVPMSNARLVSTVNPTVFKIKVPLLLQFYRSENDTLNLLGLTFNNPSAITAVSAQVNVSTVFVLSNANGVVNV